MSFRNLKAAMFALLTLSLISSNAILIQAADAKSSRAANLAATVTIYRDTYGVPHIYAKTDAGCVFGYFYAQCEDNFWQVEDNYIRSLGRAAEVYGESKLAEDMMNRALEIPKLAKAEYAKSSPKMKALSDAAADAYNYFLAMHPEIKPRLLSALEGWMMYAFNRYALYQNFIFGKTGLKVDEIKTAVREEGSDAPATTSSSGEEAELQEVLLTDETKNIIGSNMWAITPAKSATGHAMLLINPHQPFFGPFQWYEGHVHSEEGWNMSGASFYGSGFPTIGHNDTCGWSHTVNDPDITDLWVEKFDDAKNPLAYRYGNGYKTATEWSDTLKVKTASGFETKTYKFRKTHHGPVVAVRKGMTLAVQMARLVEGGMIDEWYEMGKARDVAEFKKAMSRAAIPMFNAVAADSQGNIFYVYNGAVPRRSTKFDWTKPVDGSNPETDWQGFHAFDELPQLMNPRTNYVQNCNQTPFTTTTEGNPETVRFPEYMTREQDNARAKMSRRILSTTAKFTFDDWTRSAWDTHILESETQIPQLVAEWEKLKTVDAARAEKLNVPIAELKAFNHLSTYESKGMTLFALWFEKQMRSRSKDEWSRITALEQVIADLERNWGTWQVAWGEINRLQKIQSGGELEKFADAKKSIPVAGAPGWLGIINNFYTRMEPGNKRAYGVAGTSFVSVVEFGPKVQARSLLVMSESYDPNSPHYFDQSELYGKREFKPAWFSLPEIKANSHHVYHPGEEMKTMKKAA